MRLPLLLGVLALLAGDLETALRNGDWDAARSILTKQVAKEPGKFGAAYNLACVEARAGRVDAAIVALRLAAERGFPFVATLLRDEDLDRLRGHPGYAAALERVKENNARALEAFRPRVARAKVILKPPPDRSRPAPLIVALHPSGGAAATFAPLFVDLAKEMGAALAVPEGLNASGDGYDWGVVEQGTLLVEGAVARAKETYAIDANRVILAGYSNGASTALIMALRRPDAYAGVLSIGGFYEERVSPVPSGKALPRFALLVGQHDDASGSNRRAAAALEASGGAVRLKVFAGLGHALPPDPRGEIRGALRYLLGLEPAPER